MRKPWALMFAVAVICGLRTFEVAAWGLTGHVVISRTAINTLPGDVPGFVKRQIDWIGARSITPDSYRAASEPFITCKISAVAVCCCKASRSSVRSRVFSIAITAWAAKFCNNAICLSLNGCGS